MPSRITLYMLAEILWRTDPRRHALRFWTYEHPWTHFVHLPWGFGILAVLALVELHRQTEAQKRRDALLTEQAIDMEQMRDALNAIR